MGYLRASSEKVSTKWKNLFKTLLPREHQNMASLETTLTLIGGPTVLIELGGLRLLTDPTFDEPGKYEARGIVLEKKSGPALSADQLGMRAMRSKVVSYQCSGKTCVSKETAGNGAAEEGKPINSGYL
jgi:hypothetical protein